MMETKEKKKFACMHGRDKMRELVKRVFFMSLCVSFSSFEGRDQSINHMQASHCKGL